MFEPEPKFPEIFLFRGRFIPHNQEMKVGIILVCVLAVTAGVLRSKTQSESKSAPSEKSGESIQQITYDEFGQVKTVEVIQDGIARAYTN